MRTRTKVAKAIVRDRRSVKELTQLLRREVSARKSAEQNLKQQEERFARLFGYRVECSYHHESKLYRSCIQLDADTIHSVTDKKALIYDVAAQLVRHILGNK